MRRFGFAGAAVLHGAACSVVGGCLEDPRRERPGSTVSVGGRHRAVFAGSSAGGEAAERGDGGANSEAGGTSAGEASVAGGSGTEGGGGLSAEHAAAGLGGIGGGEPAGPAGAGAGGTSGEAGGGSLAGRAAALCSGGPFGNPLPSNRVAARITGVPPADAFNANGAARHNIEGPLWWSGALYVSEFPLVPVPESRILKITIDGTVSVQREDTGSNGLALDVDDAVLIANHRDGTVERMDLETGASSAVAESYDGARFNSPNDIAVRADGNLYFTDPSWQAPVAAPQPATRVYRVAPGGELSVVDDTRAQPNGISLSLDEDTLYVAGLEGVYDYPVFADGSVGAGTPLENAPGGVDGMALDCAGNLYLTRGRSVVVLDRAGERLGLITVSDSIETLTNVAFGGAERKTLYITGLGTSRGLFALDLNIPGMPF